MKKVVFILLFSLFFFQESPAIAEMEVLFSPGERIKEILIKEIESATSTLELAIHEITSLDMTQALINAKQRGVKVRIITDTKQSKMRSSKITNLIHQGIPIKVLGTKERGVMNHRFVIFDGQKVITGSFDWSEASGRWNYENILILRDSEIVASYQKEFERLWREKRVIE